MADIWTYDTEIDNCPHCGRTFDACTNIEEDRAPEPGDVTICIDCAGPCFFGDDMKLRLPTAEEQNEIDASPDVQYAINSIRLMKWAKMGGEE